MLERPDEFRHLNEIAKMKMSTSVPCESQRIAANEVHVVRDGYMTHLYSTMYHTAVPPRAADYWRNPRACRNYIIVQTCIYFFSINIVDM